jgi:2-C-methyl-D-erythritol 2,4-cyclodiphosphate synthase
VVEGGIAGAGRFEPGRDAQTVAGASGLRVGIGFDVHPFAEPPTRPLVLGGVVVDERGGLAGVSDADVVCHALADALLGAAGLGDLGAHFPPDDPRSQGARSTDLLAEVVQRVLAAGWQPLSADASVVGERPRLAPYLGAMRDRLSSVLGAPVSVKATSPEGLGSLGRAEGIACMAVALLASGSLSGGMGGATSPSTGPAPAR